MISICFTGDIAFSGHFKGNKQNILSNEILTFLNKSDYVIANIECPITNSKIKSDRPLNHFMGKEYIPTLKEMNANIWNLGNNHILDCGVQGLKDTLSVAEKEGIKTIGVGFNQKEALKPIIINGDVKIGVVSIVKPWKHLKSNETTPGCICITDLDNIKLQINALRNKVNYIVAIIHGGEEFSNMPMPYDRKKYLKILNLGIDIIVAHHPHVIQNYEKIGNKIIFYSLGNFIFDTDFQRLQVHTDEGILLNIKFDKKGYVWNYLPININRYNQTITVRESPAIFTNITRMQYRLLWPLAARRFLDNNKKAKKYKNGLKVKSKEKQNFLQRIKRKISCLKNKRELILNLGKCIYYLQIWKLSTKKDVIDYILQNSKD